MHQQYKTAGILCARVGVSCSRGREDGKNTCESCNKTRATTFTMLLLQVALLWWKALWQLKHVN